MEKFKYRKYYFIGLILALAMVLAMFLPTILQGLPFEYGGDLKPQHFQFYTEFRKLMSEFIHNFNLPFYSWDMFLGNNFYASKAYYIMGDIYAYFSLIFDMKFYDIFVLLTVIKLAVAYSTFFLLMRIYDFSGKACLIGGLSYAFSSWVFFFIGQPMFVSVYSFIPLYFAGMEYYLRTNRYSLYLVSVPLLLFTNYYIFFAVSMFSPIYYLVRYYVINRGFKNDLVRKTLFLIMIYIIGAMITAVLIFPAAKYIVQNDRVGSFFWSFRFEDIQIYFHELQAAIVPSQLLIYREYNIFETNAHLTREICMWAGSVTAILVPQIFTDKDRYYSNAYKVLYLIFILTMVIPSGSMIMLGFSSYSLRWVLLVIMMNILVSGRYLSDTSRINHRNLQITLVVIIAILVLNYPATLLAKGEWALFMQNFESYRLSLTMIIVFVSIYLIIRKAADPARYLIIITVLELLICNYTLIAVYRADYNSSWEFVDNVTHVLQSEKNGFNDYLDQQDDDNYRQYYRVYVPRMELYWDYSHNQAVFYDLNGVMTYDSTYSPAFDDMKKIYPQVIDFGSEWIFTIENQYLLEFLNVKYAVVTTPDILPEGNYSLIDDNYLGGLYVYENNNYRSIGNTYNKVITYDDIDQSGSDVEKILDHVICKDEDFDEISRLIGNEVVSLQNISYENNYFYGDIRCEEDGFMVITLPYDKGWNVQVNGQAVTTYRVNGGMMGIRVNEGYNEVSMTFIPDGLKTGFAITALGALIALILLVREFRTVRKKR